MEMFKKIKKLFLNILGDIKVYRFPFFMIYDPTTFLIKGYHTRQAINAIQTGCIVLRGYKCYADGFFIPGDFSHSGIYVGDGKIVHAIAEGVQEIDIMDFLRCDRFCILKPKDQLVGARAAKKSLEFIGKPYDFDFVDGEEAFYCHEMTRTCYSELDIEKKEVRILGVKVKPRYTCDSFMESDDFEKIMEIIPDREINFSKKA